MKSQGIPALTRLDVCPDRCYQHRRGLKARSRLSEAPDEEVGRFGRLTGSLAPAPTGALFIATWGQTAASRAGCPGGPCGLDAAHGHHDNTYCSSYQ